MNITQKRPHILGRVRNHPKFVMFMLLLVLALAVPTAAFAQATPAPSIEIPVDVIFESTNDWIVVFAPIVAIGLGIAIAIAALAFVGSAILQGFRGRGR